MFFRGRPRETSVEITDITGTPRIVGGPTSEDDRGSMSVP
jgi:hypothetical protein